MSKLLVKLVICTMFLSGILSNVHLQPATAEETLQQEVTYISFLLSKDAPIFNEQGVELGTLLTNKKHVGFILDGQVYFNWFDKTIKVDQATILEQSNVEKPELPAEDLQVKTIIAEDSLVVENKDSEEIAMIAQGAEFQVVAESEDSYVAFLSGQEVKVLKPLSAGEIEQEITTPGEKETLQQENKDQHDEIVTENEVLTNEEQVEQKAKANAIEPSSFASSDQYFQAIAPDLPVYVKKDGDLIQVATLEENQIYARTRDYTSWHQILLGNQVAYVGKENTLPSKGESVKNLYNQQGGSGLTLTITTNAEIYDNTGSDLVPFGTLNQGLRLQVVKVYTSWYAVQLGGRLGYVRSDQAKLDFPTDADYFKVTEDNLPIYDKSSGDLVEIGQLTLGQVYPRTRDYTSWHAVKVGNITAYVSKDGTQFATGASVKNETKENNQNEFITFHLDTVVYDNTSGDLVAFAMMKKGVKMPVLNHYSNWYSIDVAGRTGYVRKADVTSEFTSNTQYFEVLEDGIVAYQKVNGKLVEVTTLMKNQVYPRVSDHTSWHGIKFGGRTVYVKKDGTRPATAKMIKNENTGLKNSPYKVTITNNTFVYDNTSGDLVAFAELYQDNEYPIISDHGNWLKVDVSGRIGYVKKEDTKIEFTESIEYFSPTQNNLPIYDNSSGSLVIVGYLKAGEVYHRTQDYTSWHQIQFGDIDGYVKKDLTLPVLNQTYRNESDRYVKVGQFKANTSTPIYYYVGSELIPFAYIKKGELYPYVEDRGSYVKVNLGDRYGYVSKADVTLQYKVGKDLVNPKVVYTYNQMTQDIDEIVATYSGLAEKKVIGKSVDGRNIYAVKLGKGSTEILINASHHAREFMTTNIVMEMMDQYAQGYVKNSTIDGYSVKSILDHTSIWFVPMVNPDGVTLVQKGHKSAKNPNEVLRINNGSKDFSSWKANIRGVDLNRQYPAGWDYIVSDPGKPATQNYKGPKPLSEPESKAMYDFTNGKGFKTSVSYHSSGEIIYWHFKQGSARTERDRKIAEMIKSKTGYSLVTPKANPSGGGFTDWFISTQLNPGFTPEISPYVGPRPVPLTSFDSIWAENKAIGIMLAEEAFKNRNNR